MTVQFVGVHRLGDKYDWIDLPLLWYEFHTLCHPCPLSVTQVAPQVSDKVIDTLVKMQIYKK